VTNWRSIGELAGTVMQRVEGMTEEGGAAMERAPAPGLRAESPMGMKGPGARQPPASCHREEYDTARDEGESRPVLRLVIGSKDGRARPKASDLPPLGARPSLLLVWDADHPAAASS